jgi:hypothetical protein
MRKVMILAAAIAAVAAGPAAAKSPAVCGHGDRPEPGLQGQVPKASQGDDSRKGYWCGMREIGRHDVLNRGGNYGHAWVGDCAYVTSALTGDEEAPSGIAVIDVANPRQPRFVKLLQSPGSINAVETIHARGTTLTAASYDGNKLDVYDASDCRNPRLQTTWDSPYNIHNITLSWDAKTLYAASALPTSEANQPQQHIFAIRLDDPADPEIIASVNMAELAPQGASPAAAGVHRVDVSEDGTRIYAGMISGTVLLPALKPLFGVEPDLAILDVSEIQARKQDAGFKFISQTDGSWHGPKWFKRGGKTYVVSGDEAVTNTAPASFCGGPFPTVADITDETAPKPVGKFELEINRRENCPASMDDGLLYSTHYTDVDDQEDARLGLFPMYNAGLRIADLSDPANPKEVGYFNPAPDVDTKYGNTYGPQADVIDLSGSNVRYREETGHIWFVSMTSGFHVVELASSGPAKDLGLPPAARPPAAAAKRCAAKRCAALRVKLPRGLRSATVYVNGKRVKRLRGRDLRVPVTVRRKRGAATRVKIVAWTKKGKRVVRSRRYRAC